ncbi:Putative restriction endonuclease domain-containing protein [Tumidithrix helvetica PCC 7403]|uniref:Uma2 family endonuclease n=1 Tax=Tumidithrix helvetica TaxID=3457545 RepID=UPI003CA91DEF
MIVAPQFHFPPDLESDEPPLETPRHLEQLILLLTCLQWWWRDRQDYFASGNISIYYTPEQLTGKYKFRAPDFFVVLDTAQQERSSWIVEREGGKFPNVIIEVLSRSTAKVDQTTKKQLYQDTFLTPEYFWYDPRPTKRELKGFRLIDRKYQEIQPDNRGYLWSEQLQLYLGIAGEYARYFTAQGEVVPNFQEATAQRDWQLRLEKQRAEREADRATQAEQRILDLEAKLRALGVDPDLPPNA